MHEPIIPTLGFYIQTIINNKVNMIPGLYKNCGVILATWEGDEAPGRGWTDMPGAKERWKKKGDAIRQNKRFYGKKGVFRFKFVGKTPNQQVETDKTGGRFSAALRGSTMRKIGGLPSGREGGPRQLRD